MLGHSATRIAATLAGWRVDAGLVDVVIALSVVFVGAVGIFMTRPRWNVFGTIVLAFGLVHGLGLSTRLQEVGLPEEGALRRVVAFNVGNANHRDRATHRAHGDGRARHRPVRAAGSRPGAGDAEARVGHALRRGRGRLRAGAEPLTAVKAITMNQTLTCETMQLEALREFTADWFSSVQ